MMHGRRHTPIRNFTSGCLNISANRQKNEKRMRVTKEVTKLVSGCISLAVPFALCSCSLLGPTTAVPQHSPKAQADARPRQIPKVQPETSQETPKPPPPVQQSPKAQAETPPPVPPP